MNETDKISDYQPVEGPLGEEPAPPPEIEPPFAEPLTPVAEGERMEIIDILRGVALLGILFVNLQFYTTPFSGMKLPDPYWPETQDVISSELIHFFAQGKFYTLFSFLFGLGISIQLLRAEQRGRGFLGYHFRRMAVLLGIGLIHAFFIWMGDILVTYAVLGFVLPLFFRCKPRTLLIWALAIIFALTALFLDLAGLLMLLSHVPSVASQIPAREQLVEKLQTAAAEDVRIYSQGTYLEITAHRAIQTLSVYGFVLFSQGPHSLAMFLLGLFVGKSRWFQDLPGSLPRFRRAWLLGLVVGLGGTGVSYLFASQGGIEGLEGYSYLVAGTALSFVTAPALSCFYACSLVLLYQSHVVRRVLSPISAIGQMALTNYLAQSIICSTLFYGSTLVFGLGFGLYAQLGPAVGVGLTLLIWFVELCWSILWLRVLKIKFGPMEWLWRTLTYGRIQPMR